MTRDSQAVCRAARSSVTNTNNRFQVTLYCPLIDGPKSSLYSDSWHANTHYNAWSARIHSGGGFLLMVPVTLILKKNLGKNKWSRIFFVLVFRSSKQLSNVSSSGGCSSGSTQTVADTAPK